MDFGQKPALGGMADDGKARLLGQLPASLAPFRISAAVVSPHQVGVVHNAGDLLVAFGFDAPHIGEGTLQIPGFRPVGIEHV